MLDGLSAFFPFVDIFFSSADFLASALSFFGAHHEFGNSCEPIGVVSALSLTVARFSQGYKQTRFSRADSRGAQQSCEARRGGTSRESQRRGWQCPSTPPKVANTDASLHRRITTRRLANGKTDKEPTDASYRWATDPDPAGNYTQWCVQEFPAGFPAQQGVPSYPRTNG